jgi:serine/threonine-protein kinase
LSIRGRFITLRGGDARMIELSAGQRIDRYQLVCPIATGGMGSVWVARLHGKHGFQRLVALKLIRPDYTTDDRFRAMFLNEATLASRISHPNVVPIVDLGEEAGVLFCAMEYVEGQSLNEVLKVLDKRGERLPLGITLRILADSLAGLHSAHELRGEDGQLLQVVHRDVSPHNVLISVDGVARIIDFGVAKARERIDGESTGGALKGKARYMAPEQLSGTGVDRRADLWAVGVMAYYMLAGKLPYDGENDVAVLCAVLNGSEVEPLPSSVPASIRALVAALLERDRDRRIANADEARSRIEKAMTELRVTTTTTEVARYLDELLFDVRAARRAVLAASLERIAARGSDAGPPPAAGGGANATSARSSGVMPLSESPAAKIASTQRGLAPPTPSIAYAPAGQPAVGVGGVPSLAEGDGPGTLTRAPFTTSDSREKLRPSLTAQKGLAVGPLLATAIATFVAGGLAVLAVRKPPTPAIVPAQASSGAMHASAETTSVIPPPNATATAVSADAEGENDRALAGVDAGAGGEKPEGLVASSPHASGAPVRRPTAPNVTPPKRPARPPRADAPSGSGECMYLGGDGIWHVRKECLD